MSTVFPARGVKPGNVLKWELNPSLGFSRKVATVTLTPTSKVGDIVAKGASAYALVLAATSTAQLGVIVDPAVYDLRPATGTANVEVVLVVNTAIVGDLNLNVGADIDTPAELTAVYDQLESQLIKVEKQL